MLPIRGGASCKKRKDGAASVFSRLRRLGTRQFLSFLNVVSWGGGVNAIFLYARPFVHTVATELSNLVSPARDLRQSIPGAPVMNRPSAIQAKTYSCICILAAASVALRAQDSTKATTTQTQVTNVRVGAVSIAIPSPMNDLAEPGPDYRVIFETFAPTSNRLVAAFVPQDKMDAIRKGNAPPMDEYALVEVARRSEFTDIDSAAFQRIAEEIAKQFGGDL